MEQLGNPIIPNHYFSHVSSECQLLYRDGYYYACIALCQSVAEALARFMYEKWTGNPPEKYFRCNIQMSKIANVQPDVSAILNDIYGGQQRNDFHHLNKNVPTEYEELRSIATEKIDLLNKVELEVFEYNNTGNGLIYKYPKYWQTPPDSPNVFLRIAHP
jgi:hypothetical protein